ncbi:ubiquitin-like modifier-activating enzyme 6 isoform X1 [Biomphalaria glabrata]|uniref:E1 ubiquitin-activating enzyme n=1 Tax=Biomphalaria glabrata TaxID=6526 RepID=A0A9U8EMJ5_BIOGL|nr:ubiquitin-like modifier-activating enzyme 6 isoform X1 [Biomphalaria glabrata]KAI8793388.1 ubiquitin modifier-activating enzyme 6 isoform X1 [Biomphalaria glabrata]
MASEQMEIDDSLYSRQRYVLGDAAMRRMASSSVLVYGLSGLGVEIAKNIILAGVKSITLQDPKSTQLSDLGTQFFLREHNAEQSTNRAEACFPHLAELNPYVTIETSTEPLTDSTDLSYLKKFQCVILTECTLSLQIKVNNFCRASTPQIKFLSSDVYGIVATVFADFGESFEIFDATGEESKDVFVSDITKSNPGVVSCLENRFHGLENGDVVTFREVRGMTAVNGQQFTVKVINPYTFSICDTSGPNFEPYVDGGIFTQVKVPVKKNFDSLEHQLIEPNLLIPDLCKFDAPIQLHIAYLALNKYLETFASLPKPWNEADAVQFLNVAKTVKESLKTNVDSLDEKLMLIVSHCCQGCFSPLNAIFGGVVAQEALKALTGKFTPLHQWLYMDAIEVVPVCESQDFDQFLPRGDRYDLLRLCIGDKSCQILANTKLFMVGCGAIGCEMLKNYALLGISTGAGKITITDNDLIEKSNLNRQFLFRSCHIQKPKSTTAAHAALEINKDIKIEAQQHKVGPQTEDTIYTDAFFDSQDIIVNALDNVEARRYMDGRCVTNQKPLMESGTMGTKGHVQVIVPHITESYTSQQDPKDEDFPYCTIKSFPATLEHCIQWARDKFEECFVQNAQLFNKFIETNSDMMDVAQRLASGVSIDGAVKVSKMLATRPTSWAACLALARSRFESYFNHKAKELLHAFPLDKKMEDGSLFWAAPKRPPRPLKFDPSDEMHMLFVITTARLYADVFMVKWTPEDLDRNNVLSILSEVPIPEFKPRNKAIVTDETASKEVSTNQPSGDVVEEAGQRIKCLIEGNSLNTSSLTPLEFEKDNDSNGHIDFITSTTNLRAQMYGIAIGDRFKIKKIAGRIVPAIATTTATVSGLVTVEMIKVLQHMPLEKLKNCFLNLALPVILLSEPGPVVRTVLREGLSVTIWDKWEIRGSENFTLQNFIDQCKEKFGFEASSIVQGVKIIYMPFMPGHNKKLPMQMTKLLKPVADQQYVDLVVSFDGDDGEDVPGPPVRYYF